MKKFSIYIGILLLSVLILTPTINYLVDPGHIFTDDYVKSMIEGHRQGMNVTNASNFDERQYREAFIKLYSGEMFDYIIIGSSRSMLLSQEAFPGKKILNLSVSGAKLEDAIALYQLCKDFHIKYKHVIFTADISFLNANYANDRWRSLQKYYNEYMHCNYSKNKFVSQFGKLYSFKYLHVGMVTLAKAVLRGFRFDRLIYTSNPINEGQTYRIDGSMYYNSAIVERSKKMIDLLAETQLHDSFKNFDNTTHQTNLFDKIIKSYEHNGQVIFLLSPIHPIFYAKWQREMPELLSAESWIKDYAKANDIPVIGDFNPFALGLNNTDFYDGVHCRSEILNALVSSSLTSIQD